jgi:hypothetical protein
MSSKRKAGEENQLDWKSSAAKALLRQYLKDGHVTDSTKPKKVYNLSEEFKKFLYKNFTTNLCNLQKL